jgi:hypothetical protein
VSRARQVGLSLVSRDIFLYQTVASLAANAAEAAPDAVAAQGPVTGAVPLTPVQRWFFETQPERPECFDQSVLVELVDSVDGLALRRAVDGVLTHHDALRMRFERVDEDWRQVNAPVEPVEVLRRLDLSTVDADRQQAVMDEVAGQVHTSFDLGRGPLMQVVWFDLGVGRRQVLLLAAHHLVVDGVSWRILLEDLETAYRQVSSGQPVGLGPKTTSFKDWALRLTEHAAVGGFADEVDYWTAVTHGCDPVLPVDGDGANTVGSTRAVTVRLDPRQTRALLQDVPGAYRTQVNDVLLAALGRVLAQWTGRDRVLIDLEGHGREDDLFDGVDLSRTVGWFTTIFPVALDVSGGADWGGALKSVR